MHYTFLFRPHVCGVALMEVPATALICRERDGWHVGSITINGATFDGEGVLGSPVLEPLFEALTDYVAEHCAQEIGAKLALIEDCAS